jgi:hypothetical protein
MALKIPNTNATSVGHGAGAAPDPGARRAHPRTDSPDKVSASEQGNKNQQLKAGVSGDGCKPNPGAKSH